MKLSKIAAIAVIVLQPAFISTEAFAYSPALQQVRLASNTAEQGVESCAAKLSGKPLTDCVGAELSKYSGRLAVKGAEKLAPQGAPTASSAAGSVRTAATVAAAASVLNKASSVIASLEASSQGEAKLAYSSINQAFARASNVIAAKG
jgi:hypothetical protein